MAATAEATQTEDVTRTDIGVRDLLEAGLHFGHQTKRWNPKMKRYIFDKRNGIHIIDLSKSLFLLKQATEFLRETVAQGKDILFVGTKKQAQKTVRDVAEATEQHYVTHRWLGGTLTNNKTIRNSVKRMRDIQDLLGDSEREPSSKKEAARLSRELDKLTRNLSGIADMEKMPGALFVVDINRESIAVAEANRMGIPVCAMVDTSCDPDPVDYVIPGNDDAIRAIALVLHVVSQEVQKGKQEYEKKAAEIARKKAEEQAAAEAAKALKEKEQQKTGSTQQKKPAAAAASRGNAGAPKAPAPAAPQAAETPTATAPTSSPAASSETAAEAAPAPTAEPSESTENK